METTKEEKMINLNLININIEKIKKIKEHQWIQFVIVIFAIAPLILSFYFLDRILAFSKIEKLSSIVFLSVLLLMLILLIGIPLYILYIKTKYPEKVSERRYEFRVSDFQPLHYFFSSFWLSGIFGTFSFLICLIFSLSQTYFIIMLYGYMLLRLIILTPLYLYRNKINKTPTAL
jgi:hypothetical protein